MPVAIEIVGAIALLLWGLRMVRSGVLRAFGTWLKRLASRTEGRWIATFWSGVVTAALMQSSTAAAMIVASFSGKQVVGVTTAFIFILGADVGTAIAVQIASQKITFLSPLLITAGVFIHLSVKSSVAKNCGRALIGLGLILLALTMVARGAAELANTQTFIEILRVGSEIPAFLFIVSVLLTYFAHSSLAVVLLVTGLVAGGVLDFTAGIYCVLGANFGGALLPIVSSWGSHRDARIPVTANALARGFMVLGVWPFVGKIIEAYPMANNPAVYLPLFHLVFNIAVALAGLVLQKPILWFSSLILPKSDTLDKKTTPRYLSEEAMNSPKTALASATREALRIADTVKGMLSDVLPVLANNDHELRKKIERSDDRVDTLFSHTKHYIATLMKKELSQEESEQALDILSFTANLEHIGDIIDLNLMEIAGKKIAAQTSFSSEGMTEIGDLHSAVSANFDLAVSTFISNDPDLAALLLETKSNIRTLERESVSTHIDRIGSKLPNTLNTSSLHLDVLRDLKRINSHLTVVAYPVLRRFGELPESGSSS